jgi:eukaryotic-like serine/threonine-protein kinase
VIEQAQSEEVVFLAAMQLATAQERVAYVQGACADDEALRRRVLKLLASHDASRGPLDVPPPGVGNLATIDQPLTELPGTLIGPYKLLEQIGEGGMGIVYMAQQTQPVKRKVALKVIKPGMDSKQVIARFEAERQALAMMDHPNIARVLDADATDNGRPYFVMELVRGVPTTEYCDKQRLNTRDRLKLFLDICHAVQHAHLKGIIHRDLKPSNVLITLHDGVPVVKVIDFGVAKALNQELTEKTLFTQFSQMVGTPLYMSPEQAELSGLDIDTRTDVYSLGVLLYELLTGTTPFDKDRLTNVGFDEMRRIIREDEPPRPSTRISTVRAAGKSTATGTRDGGTRQLSRLLRGELDWIVMKALEKDRSRRYESSSALAADIQRYLSDEPVLACPPTTMYRFQKFARKHKPALATAAAIALCLILGTTVSAWQAARATTAEAQANANATQAQASSQEAKEKAQEATTQRDEAHTQRDEAQRQRDEVKALNDKLLATQQDLQRTLYRADINLAKHAWDAGTTDQMVKLLEQHRPKPGESDLRGFEWHYLYRLCHSELLTMKGSPGRVWSVAYSPDGKRLATGAATWIVNDPGKVMIWDAQTGQELLSLKGHTKWVHCVAFSPDGKRLASVSSDETVKVWDAETGQELLTYKGHSGVTKVAFSPDGKRLASGSSDGTVKVWNAQSGEELLTLKDGGGNAVAFSPDGKRIAGGSKVWDAQTGQDLLSLKGHTDWVHCVAFSADGNHLASASGDNLLKVWDAQTGRELVTFKGHSGIRNVAFSPDGKRLSSGSSDGTVKVWDAQTGQELLTFKGHTSDVWSVAFSPDGTKLASGSNDGTVKVWDATASPEARTISGPTGGFSGVDFSPDGKRLASGSGTWDATKKAHVSGEVKVWDTQSGQELVTVKGLVAGVNNVAFSPDGKRMAGATADKTVKVWDAQSGQELLALEGGFSVIFSPDGKRLAGTSDDNTVKLWDAQSGQELLTLKGHTHKVYSVAFSPDGKRLASRSGDWTDNRQGYLSGQVKVWDAQTGQELLSLKVNNKKAGSVAFSPDGKRLAWVSAGILWQRKPGEMKVWDAQTGQELLALNTIDIYSSVAFSPDGKRLASATRDNTVKVWDAQSGHELLSVTLPGGATTVAFSPDGHRLASNGSNGTVKIYNATPLPEKPLAFIGSVSPVIAADKAVIGLVSSATAPNDLTGTWTWSRPFSNNNLDFTLKLKQEGDKFTGTIRQMQELPIQEASFEDGTISFKVVFEFMGSKFIQTFTGTKSGDTITGKMETDRDGQTMSRDWEAKRQKE